MATCPDCGSYLGDAHVCTRKLQRQRVRQTLVSALAGAVLGAAAPLLLTGSPTTLLGSLLSSILGGLIAVSIVRAVPR